MAGVCQQRAVLHPLEVLGPQHPPGAGDRHEDVTALGRLERRHHLVAGHPRLERPQRIDLGDDHIGARAPGSLSDPQPCPAIAADDQRVAREQHVAGADDAVERRLTGPVAVVQRPLGAGLVGRQDRAVQATVGLQPAKAVNARGRLLDPAEQPMIRLVGGDHEVRPVVKRHVRAARD